jgi:hypothetical protein
MLLLEETLCVILVLGRVIIAIGALDFGIFPVLDALVNGGEHSINARS